MIKNRDIIVMGIQAWDIEIGSNCKNIASEMARHNRVLYVNPPMDRISKFRQKNSEKIKKRCRIRKGLDNDLIQLTKGLWNLYPKRMTESINFLPNHLLFDTLNKINAKRFSKDVQSAIKRLGFKDYIIFNDSSMFLGQHMQEFLKPSCYVYYMRDYLIKNPYWKKNGVRLEPKLIQMADCVVNNSTLYTEYGRQYNPHSYMVGQGCDTTLFDSQLRNIPSAKDLAGIPRPIIGYVGYLSSRRLDIPLLSHIADTRPDWHIVLVGPEDQQFQESNLHHKKNIHFLGSREAQQLPNYIKGFDVAINPQLINEATMGNYPRKIDEYLAMGKPTVASQTKAMEYFKEYTYLGKTPAEYVQLIDLALKENSMELEEQRRQFGLSHSWENNVNEIYASIQKVSKVA